MCGLIIIKTQREEKSEEDRGMTIIRELSHWEPTNSIERLDTTNKSNVWSIMNIPISPLTPRCTPGCVQTSPTEILIFGGSTKGKELRASYRFNVFTETVTKF
mmetsp:Transcript_1140/g.1501  ORF Transcript_1140/g.1501 Transcript_1140/m.1501 type:complete len:103 (-) Transcript_1140:230-538(-)